MDVTESSHQHAPVGRCFIHPVVDCLLVGGALSLIVIPAVYFGSGGALMMDFGMLPWLLLLSNSSHFAASTVRLYSKDGTREALPMLTMMLPAVCLILLTFAIFHADSIGAYIQALYLTWSPYHYAAQAYGLAVMYCYRSGFQLTSGEKRILFWVAMPPFFKVLVFSLHKSVFAWHAPTEVLWGGVDWAAWIARLDVILGAAGLILPVAAFGYLWRRHGKPAPLMSSLVIATNAIWFIVFPVIEGFMWTTIFHGVQYLTIVMIFHVRERMAAPGNRRSPMWHAIWFYAMSVGLGYALFNCMPYGFAALGFGIAESILLVVAAINIHHFIVDAYIWKLGGRDVNARIIDAGSPATDADTAS